MGGPGSENTAGRGDLAAVFLARTGEGQDAKFSCLGGSSGPRSPRRERICRINKGKSANLAEAHACQTLDTKDPFQHLSKFGRQFSPRFLKG